MSNALTILVVDDDDDFRTFYRLTLERAGYRVLEAEDGNQAAEQFAAEQPDLILLDVIMEEVDAGFTLAEKLGKEVPIILISSIADSSVKVFDAHQLPVRDIIQKPVKPDVLLERIRKVVSS